MTFTGTIDGEGYALITTPAELKEMENNLNDATAKFRLANEIGLGPSTSQVGGAYYNSGNGWAPIGSAGNTYQGEFDLNGFGITGLTINRGGGLQGLFYELNGANVYDGFIEGTVETNDTGGTGLLFARAVDCTLSRLVSRGTVTNTRGGSVEIGGLGGRGIDSLHTNCVNEASVISTQNQGRVGGLVGYAENISVARQFTDCINRGSIQSDHSRNDVGAIAGEITGGLIDERQFNCLNDRELSGYPDLYIYGDPNYKGIANKSTADLQEIETYRELYVGSQGGNVTTSGTTVTYVSGDDFSTLSAGQIMYILFTKFTIASITSATELEVTVAPPTYSSSVFYRVGTGSFGLEAVYDMATLQNRTTEVWGIDDGNAFPQLNWQIEAGGQLTVNLSGTPLVDADVLIFECDNVNFLNRTIHEQGVTNSSGVFTTSQPIDPSKLYYWLAHKVVNGQYYSKSGFTTQNLPA